MKNKNLFQTGLIIVLSGLIGCASSTVQTDALLSQPTDLPRSHKIIDVPFIDQTSRYCGPATLAMAMNWAGKSILVEQLASQVYTPGMEGTLQTDMISAARRNGMMAVPISGLHSLLKEVSVGHPVIVFKNLALTWFPMWHYAIVTGYDLNDESIIMHSGKTADKKTSMRKFERSWKMADYWGLIILPPGELIASASELAHATAAAGLEASGQLEAAEKSYLKILERWPYSLGALIGLGNISFGKMNYSDSIRYLTLASQQHPYSAFVWHNLAIAQGAAKRYQEARASAEQALALVSSDHKLQYEHNLQSWLN